MESSVCQQYERSSLINFFYFSCLFQEGEAFLEEHGGVHENAKTRAQQKEIEESEEDSATKLKRTSTGSNYNMAFDNCHHGSQRMMDVGKGKR